MTVRVRDVARVLLLAGIAWACWPAAAHAQTAPPPSSSPVPAPATAAGDRLPDSGDTRLTWLPTARTLPRGTASVTLFGPMPIVQVGITDRFSAGVGFFGFNLFEGRLFIFTPKYRVIDRPRTKFAVGAYHVAGFVDASGGLAYGVLTRGSEDAAVHGGVGWWYARADSERGSTPMAFFGADRRLSAHLKLVGDVSVLESYWTSTLGLRIIRKHGAGDIGLAVLPLGDSFVVFPTFLMTWRF